MRSDQRERLAMARVAMTALPEKLMAHEAGISTGNLNMRSATAGASASSKPAPSRAPSHARSISDFKLQELTMLSLTPLIQGIQRWWLQRSERHYLICADVELQRAREANINAAYYQKQATLARLAAHRSSAA